MTDTAVPDGTVSSGTGPTMAELFDPAHRADPYPAYRRWREHDPVAAVDAGFFVLTGHRECSEVLRDPRFGHLDAEQLTGPANPVAGEPPAEPRKPSFLMLNPPDHTRLRRLVSRAFTPRMIDRLAPRIEEITAGLVGAAVAAGTTDLLAALAAPLPVIVISELLGVPADDHERFVGWSHAMARGLDPDFLLPPQVRDEQARARVEFADYFRELAARRRVEPGDDLLSALVAVTDAGETLTEDELLATCTLLLIAGHETTTNLVGNGVLALLRHPEQRDALVADPSLVDGAVEEMLRYDSPVQLTARAALEDATVGDVAAPAGTFVLAMIGAANRDPAAHEAAESFDITRPPTRHLAFGQGIHFCLGSPLARLEGRIALRELITRAPRMRLAGEPVWKENVTLRGLASLPVALA
ncbi:cytochrome P450 [Pseudonocardia lacus]|uniref:cytochrome P450 n=1 Tax=Pseudonocardia lacus TaxID=2835865 RepID=UPI0020276E61|nr:cytochrome P450 [Pseudonocardia lacus]